MLELFGLEGPKEGFSPEDSKKLKGGLDYYYNVVESLLKKNVGYDFKDNIMNDDEKLSFLAYKVMMADISYNGNGTLTGWRKQCFKYAIGNIADKINSKPQCDFLSDVTLGQLVGKQDKGSMETMELLTCLNDREKEMLIDHYINGCTMVELGEREGVSKQRIEQIIRNAEGKIREKYEVETDR